MMSGRRNSYTVASRSLVVHWVRENEATYHGAARHFSIDRKRIREWMDKYDEFKRGGAQGKRRRLTTSRSPLFPDLEQCLFILEEERSEGRPVSNTALPVKALQIAGGLKLDDLHASVGWLWRRKRWNNVGIRAGTNTSQKVPADYADLLHIFCKAIITLRKASDIQPS